MKIKNFGTSFHNIKFRVKYNGSPEAWKAVSSRSKTSIF